VSVRPPLDLSVYLVVGPDVTAGRPVPDLVLDAVQGGVTAVQLRWKDGATRAFVEEARALVALLRPLGIPLIVNDRVDVALAAEADGVHVGQSDMAAADVRRLVGPKAIVGLSVTNLHEGRALDAAVVDYAGVGPVFATPTKTDATPPLGLARTAEICRALAVPAVAIGGIGHDNAAHLRAAGIHGVAVVSAICGDHSPRAAAARLAALMRPVATERAG
jgi:thiamine-phosphate pyrophosphorylase